MKVGYQGSVLNGLFAYERVALLLQWYRAGALPVDQAP